MTLHFIDPHRTGLTACGRRLSAVYAVADTSTVDCARCSGTHSFGIASNIETANNRALVKETLDMFIERLHDIANERGYCDEYDAIMEQAQVVLPHGYIPPRRTREFRLRQTEFTVQAMSVDEVLEMIAEDPAAFIEVDG